MNNFLISLLNPSDSKSIGTFFLNNSLARSEITNPPLEGSVKNLKNES